MRRLMALVLCAAMSTAGCASGGYRVAAANRRSDGSAVRLQLDREALVEFARHLAPGTRIRVTFDHRTMRGTLLKVGDDVLVLQPRTRIPEPAVEIPLASILALDVDQPNSVGKAVAIGVATGAATALGLLLLIVAIAISD